MKRRDWLAGATLGAGLGALPAQAQTGFDRPPEAPQAPAVVPPEAEQARLENGLRIVLLRRPGAPRTTVRLIGEGGWLRDPVGKEGLAEVALSMLAQGAKRGGDVMDSADIAYAADLLGLPLRLELQAASAELALEAVPEQVDDAVALLADLVRAPLLAFEALEHIRSRALDALVLRRSDALLLAPWAARRLAWGRSLPVSTATALKRLKREDVQNFHRQQWRPERAQLLFCGDLTLTAARQMADDFFDDWRGAKVPPAPVGAGAALSTAASPTAAAQLLPLSPPAQGCRLIVQTTMPRGTPPVLRALARTLMQQRVTARFPLAWSSELESFGAATSWRLAVTLPPAVVAEQLTLLREQLPLLAAEPITPDDLAMAQALALGEWQQRLVEAPDELAAHALVNNEMPDLLAWAQRLRAVSGPVLQLLMSDAWREQRTQLLLIGEPGPLEPLQRIWPGLGLATMRAVIGE